MRKILSGVLIYIFVTSTMQAQLPVFITDSLDTYITRSMKASQIPGLAICIVKDGEVVVMKGYGIRQDGKKDKVDEHTIFVIASNTKAFTATGLAMLAEEGLCDLNDKVIKWVPEFTMKDKWVQEHVSLTDILCHRVGMATFQGDFMIFNADLTSAEVIFKMGNLTPEHDFRTKWGYYNTGFLIAGEVIVNITKSSWAEFMYDRFFIPLEMHETIPLGVMLDVAKNKASAHTSVEGELKVIDYSDFDQLAPAGAISSSINDMSHWLLVQLNDGIYNGKEIIPASVIKKTRTPHSIRGNGWSLHNRSHFSLYGLGWSLADYEGSKIVRHTGGLEGFVSSVTLLPGEDLGIVVLTNSDDNTLFLSLASEIIDAFLGLEYRNYASFYQEYSQRKKIEEQVEINVWRDSVDLNIATPIELLSYEGYYDHEVYGYVLIEVDKNNLIISFEHHPGLTALLEYMGNDRFLCTYNKPAYGIKVLPLSVLNGRGNELLLKVADFVDHTTYTFVRMDE